MPGLWIILYVGCMIGAVVYAFYSECDPISAGLISSKDQVCCQPALKEAYMYTCCIVIVCLTAEKGDSPVTAMAS